MRQSHYNFEEFKAYLTNYWLTDFANVSAYFYQCIPDINWVGFYLSDGEKLRLGPFMGRPACVVIPFDKGVCGAAFTQKKTLVVEDVHAFPGHISCDSESRSELVIPLFYNNLIFGVLDIDSPKIARFKEDDNVIFEKSMRELTKQLRGDLPLAIQKALQ